MISSDLLTERNGMLPNIGSGWNSERRRRKMPRYVEDGAKKCDDDCGKFICRKDCEDRPTRSQGDILIAAIVAMQKAEREAYNVGS